MPSALGPRRAQAGGTPPLSSGRRRHRLPLCAALPLALRALKPQSPAAAQVPPPSPTPLPSSRQSSQSPISRDLPPDRPDPARDTTACTCACAASRERARACAGRRLPSGPDARPLSSLASPLAALVPRRRRVRSFHPEIGGRGAPPLSFPLPIAEPPARPPATDPATEKLALTLDHPVLTPELSPPCDVEANWSVSSECY